ncbi:MAG: hypothetical protein MZW92_04620 [Comamonadaceae bacterium]|nr:hypothetical protein [Comamonadaceae bacterium]
MLGWAPGGMIGQPGAVGLAERRGLRRRSASCVGPALARGERWSSSGAARRTRRQHLPGARARRAPIDPERPADGGTVWIVEDVTERAPVRAGAGRARATTPRPPAAPRAPSWPTPATSCARR